VFVRDKPADPWEQGEITSLSGGIVIVKVRRKGMDKAKEWKEVTVDKTPSTGPWKKFEPAGVRDSESDDWKYGQVMSLTSTGEPEKVLVNSLSKWNVAYARKFYLRLPQGFGCL